MIYPEGMVELTNVRAQHRGRVKLLFVSDGWVEIEDHRDWEATVAVAGIGMLVIGLLLFYTGFVGASWLFFGALILVTLGYIGVYLTGLLAMLLGGFAPVSRRQRRKARHEFSKTLSEVMEANARTIAAHHPGEALAYRGANIARIDMADVRQEVLVTVHFNGKNWVQYRADRAVGRELLAELDRVKP